MSFDKFLLAVESRHLSHADKSIIRVSERIESIHFSESSGLSC
jgi:hypothetical protein